MKLIKHISIMILLLNSTPVFSQQDTTGTTGNKYPVSAFTLEPAIGLKPYPVTDAVLSTMVQWNVTKRLSVVSYTAYSHNSAFLRNFNYIHTDYNYSLTQTFGIGTSRYTKHSSHTFSLMAGLKYDAFKETLDNPEFEKVSMSVSSLSPDFALMYGLKIGRKKYFFSYRMVVPLYPYPFLTSDVNALDGNLANISVEMGVGVRLK